MSNKRILIVDDEMHIRELIAYNLKTMGYEIVEAENGEEALEIFEKEEPDLILLDIMMPGIDGLEVLRQIRQTHNQWQLPVIFITAKGEEIDKVVGLELGADDYLVKPFGVHELQARVKTVLRRLDSIKKAEPQKEDIIIADDLTINKTRHEVIKEEEVIVLTHKEFQLLYRLAKKPGRVYEREFLLETIWGYQFLGETRTIDVHIRNLRKKLKGDYIRTVRGVGYKFEKKD